jgi:hypothetical protein
VPNLVQIRQEMAGNWREQKIKKMKKANQQKTEYCRNFEKNEFLAKTAIQLPKL